MHRDGPLFYMLMLLAPRATLFPYTTLFRSRCPTSWRAHTTRIRRNALTAVGGCGTVNPMAEIELAPLDRKSTRLNSSHMSISYAVFCLKKKRAFQGLAVQGFGGGFLAEHER